MELQQAMGINSRLELILQLLQGWIRVPRQRSLLLRREEESRSQ